MARYFTFPKDDYLLIGVVAKAHGMRGEVKIFPYSGDPANIAGYKELTLVDTNGRLTPILAVIKSRAQGKVAIVQLATIENRNLSEEIEGMGVLLAKKHLPEIGSDEFYWHQLQGKDVVDQKGKTIGKVTSLFSNGAQDIMVVQTGKNEILIPVLKHIIVEETETRVVIQPPPGLLSINDQV
jgi:16S rRNA processing protein RimM